MHIRLCFALGRQADQVVEYLANSVTVNKKTNQPFPAHFKVVANKVEVYRKISHFIRKYYFDFKPTIIFSYSCISQF